jgi:RHS repeat-associated protein
VLQDGQGSNRITTNNDGTIREIITFDAFGNRADGFGHNATDPTNLNHLYVGEHYDSESGFYHLRARDYDPAVGRFTARDVFGGVWSKPLTLNKYVYANSDPMNVIDPSGRFGLVSFSFSTMTTTTVRFLGSRAGLSFAGKIVAEILFEMATGIPVITSPKQLIHGVRNIKSVVGNLGEVGKKLQAGKDFEATVIEVLRLKKNTQRFRGGVDASGVSKGYVIPDVFSKRSGLLMEVKTSAGAVKKKQFQEFILVAQENNMPLTMTFLKKPSPADVGRMQKWAKEVGAHEKDMLVNILHILD